VLDRVHPASGALRTFTGARAIEALAAVAGSLAIGALP
jgi:hypothetical protein